MSAIPIKTRVAEEASGKLGTTCPPTMFGFDEGEDVCVRFDDEAHTTSMSSRELTILGPGNAMPSLISCGAGRGKDCCIFLTLGKDGFECERHGDLRMSIILRKHEMGAQREPTEAYPDCMRFSPKNPAQN